MKYLKTAFISACFALAFSIPAFADVIIDEPRSPWTSLGDAAWLTYALLGAAVAVIILVIAIRGKRRGEK